MYTPRDPDVCTRIDDFLRSALDDPIGTVNVYCPYRNGLLRIARMDNKIWPLRWHHNQFVLFILETRTVYNHVFLLSSWIPLETSEKTTHSIIGFQHVDIMSTRRSDNDYQWWRIQCVLLSAQQHFCKVLLVSKSIWIPSKRGQKKLYVFILPLIIRVIRSSRKAQHSRSGASAESGFSAFAEYCGKMEWKKTIGYNSGRSR